MKNPFSKKAAKKQAEPIVPAPDPVAEAAAKRIADMEAINNILGAAIRRVYDEYYVVVVAVQARWTFESEDRGGNTVAVQHEFMRLERAPKP